MTNAIKSVILIVRGKDMRGSEQRAVRAARRHVSGVRAIALRTHPNLVEAIARLKLTAESPTLTCLLAVARTERCDRTVCGWVALAENFEQMEARRTRILFSADESAAAYRRRPLPSPHQLSGRKAGGEAP